MVVFARSGTPDSERLVVENSCLRVIAHVTELSRQVVNDTRVGGVKLPYGPVQDIQCLCELSRRLSVLAEDTMDLGYTLRGHE